MSRLRFRRAVRADVDQIVGLVESAYRGDASRRGWTTEAELLEGQRTDAAEVAALIADPESVILLAREDERVLASVLVQRSASGAYLGMFAVSPTEQARGVGRALLQEAERFARETLHATTLEMTVIAQRSELIAWYERRGYAATGETRPFPYGDPRFGLPRRDDLHFVVLEKTL